jgi:hypothetical protein
MSRSARSALEACNARISERLVSPGSARFGKLGEQNVAVRGKGLTGKAGAVTVVGWVDSQNPFGALLRNVYRCDQYRDAQGNWYVYDARAEPNGTVAAMVLAGGVDQTGVDTAITADTTVLRSSAPPKSIAGDQP